MAVIITEMLLIIDNHISKEEVAAMLKANTEAKLQREEQKLKEVEDNLIRMDRLLESYKKICNQLLSDRSDIIWKIEELKEEMEND